MRARFLPSETRESVLRLRMPDKHLDGVLRTAPHISSLRCTSLLRIHESGTSAKARLDCDARQSGRMLPSPLLAHNVRARRMSRFVLSAALLFTIASCESPLGIRFGRITYVVANAQSERIELRTIDSTSRFDRVRAQFRDSVVAYGITVEHVAFNRITLPLIDATEGEYGFDSSRVPSIAPGAMQVFDVKEGRGFPSLEDSVQFPVELDATVPLTGATFSKRDGIELAWAPATDSGSTVRYWIATTPDRLHAFNGYPVPDDGVHVIEPRVIEQFAPGRAYVFITRLRTKQGRAYDDRVYVIAAASTTIIEVTLVP